VDGLPTEVDACLYLSHILPTKEDAGPQLGLRPPTMVNPCLAPIPKNMMGSVLLDQVLQMRSYLDPIPGPLPRKERQVALIRLLSLWSDKNVLVPETRMVFIN
jgi:hypothetical protein